MYSKDNCPWCVRARDFLREKNITNVSELKIGREVTAEDFRKIAAANGKPSTVPLIFYRTRTSDGWTVLGGFEDLEKFFEER
jgi:glutaredoxin